MTTRPNIKQKLIRVPTKTARRAEIQLAKNGQKFGPVVIALVEMWLDGKITLTTGQKQNHV